MKYYEMMRTPDKRDPRGYIIPAGQPDFLTAIKFLNTLVKNGITIHRSTSPFSVAGKSYPQGSYVVKTAQAFRPHILDMFEPQDHPDDFPYPGGPPTPPYDNAGWTLAYQMGVVFDRVLDGFDGPFEKVAGLIESPAGIVKTLPNAVGYLLSHEVNDAFIAINRLLASGEEVYWLKQPVMSGTRGVGGNDAAFGPGAIYIPAKASTGPRLNKLAGELGLTFEAVSEMPKVESLKLRPVRVGLWDRYGGSMPSGWVRFLLERFEFPFSVVYAPGLDAGDLASKFDVLIFVGGAIPMQDPRGSAAGGAGFGMPDPAQIPAEWRDRIGNVTVAKTVPELRKFLEAGGTIITIGSSTSMAYHAGLPIGSALVERAADGTERPLPRERFYIPGSILEARVDKTNPLAYGITNRVDMLYDNSPVFRLKPEAALNSVRPVAWFESDNPLRSGWAWGQRHLRDAVAVVDARVGKGKLLLYGPEITFRAQPHGTFKFLFNGIYYSRAEEVGLP